MTGLLALSGPATMSVVVALIVTSFVVSWVRAGLADRANRRDAERWLAEQRDRSARLHPSNYRDGDR